MKYKCSASATKLGTRLQLKQCIRFHAYMALFCLALITRATVINVNLRIVGPLPLVRLDILSISSLTIASIQVIIV